MRHRIFLVGHQGNLRRHACKLDMAPIVLTGTDAVEQVVVFPAQVLPPVNVPENPLFEGFLYHLLLLLCDHGFFFVQDTLFLAVLHDCIKDFCVLEIQGIFQQTVAACPLCPVSGCDKGIATGIRTFSGYIPLAVDFRILHVNLVPQ